MEDMTKVSWLTSGSSTIKYFNFIIKFSSNTYFPKDGFCCFVSLLSCWHLFNIFLKFWLFNAIKQGQTSWLTAELCLQSGKWMGNCHHGPASRSRLHVTRHQFKIRFTFVQLEEVTSSLLYINWCDHHLFPPIYSFYASSLSLPLICSLLLCLLWNFLHLSRIAEMLSATELINLACCETEHGFPGTAGRFSIIAVHCHHHICQPNQW